MGDLSHREDATAKGAVGEKGPQGFAVRDRRHWVRRAEGEGDGKGEPPAERLPTYLEQLEQRLREKEERLKAFMAEQRAENEAFRQRFSRQAERRAAAAKGEVIQPILGVLDDLSRAVEAAPKGGEPAALLEGVKLIRERLLLSLRLQGLSPVGAEGVPFDPKLHEAAGVIEVDDPALENQVLEVIESGYLLDGDLLRPARVRVGKWQGHAGVGEGEQAL